MDTFKVYSLFDINIVKGDGCYVYDNVGNRYLDLYGGHAVILIGHSHPHYIARVTDQLNRIAFYSNSVINELQIEFVKRLEKQCGYPDYSVFFINSGAEAIENAIKLASFHTGRKKVLAFNKAFHGRTSLAVQASDFNAFKSPVNEAGSVTFTQLNDIESVKRELASGEYAAVVFEGIQGLGGINIPCDDFLRQLRDVCDETGTILIADEIQSGYGRSGKFFAHQYSGIKADIIAVAKGIANGLPMAAILISPKFKAIKGQLGTTFGGNHLACSAACAVLDVMDSEKLIENAYNIGNYLLERLKKVSQIKEARGRGLMIGIEFDFPIEELRKKLLFEHHIFTGISGKNVIRLLPPLPLSKEQADHFVVTLEKVLNK
ncbi:MAG: aminotransferase class III-fold pyridoxal phosphate-dependent enzyme [Muribaculaceae bacterium]